MPEPSQPAFQEWEEVRISIEEVLEHLRRQGLLNLCLAQAYGGWRELWRGRPYPMDN